MLNDKYDKNLTKFNLTNVTKREIKHIFKNLTFLNLREVAGGGALLRESIIYLGFDSF